MVRTTIAVSPENRDRLTELAGYMTYTRKKTFSMNDAIGLLLDSIEKPASIDDTSEETE